MCGQASSFLPDLAPLLHYHALPQTFSTSRLRGFILTTYTYFFTFIAHAETILSTCGKYVHLFYMSAWFFITRGFVFSAQSFPSSRDGHRTLLIIMENLEKSGNLEKSNW